MLHLLLLSSMRVIAGVGGWWLNTTSAPHKHKHKASLRPVPVIAMHKPYASSSLNFLLYWSRLAPLRMLL